MKIPFVDLSIQYKSIKNDINQAIQQVIEETSFIGGRHVRTFEAKFAEQYGVKHCIGAANGTDALYIIMRMLGIGVGDQVITTSSSWISTSETISQTGAKPVFVDIDEYYTINVELIENAITSRTKAIIPVHLYGQAADMDKLMEIAQKHNLYIIEDCAQSHFTKYKGKNVGTFGTGSTFSFYPGKNLGAYGDAGCILTNDDALAGKCRMFANHGALIKHNHLMEGINSRLDGIQAAILNVKLPHIHQWNASRRANAIIYSNMLKDIEGIRLPIVRPNTDHTFHLFVIRVKERDDLRDHLSKNGIETAIHYPTALPYMPAYSYLKHSPHDFPEALQHHNEILSLPMYPELEEKSIKYIADIITEYYRKF